MANLDDLIQYIPYQQKDEPPRRAVITPVEIDLDGLTKTEVQILGHLVEAAEKMNSIFRDQFEPRTRTLKKVVSSMAEIASGDERETLENYLIILDLQNSPYSLLPRKNHLLMMDKKRAEEIAAQAGEETLAEFKKLKSLLFDGIETPDKANFYPDDITDEEYESLEQVINSSVVRAEDGSLRTVLNERKYRPILREVIMHLRQARDLVEDPLFQIYLDAKIMEMETGSEEARRIADYMWVKHNSPIDIVISTAIEVYLDHYKNARGAAAACVTRRNNAAEELLKAIISRVPRFEAKAPWTYKKENIDPDNLPKLKFVDVFTWAGDYVTGPFTTIAQSLPNDEWVIQNIGTVNMVYMNTGKAVHRVAGNLAAKEFLPEKEYETFKELIFDANQLHSALHEIGHTTGVMDPEHRSGQPKDYFEEEYSFLEEARAELFGLWSLGILVEDGIVSPLMARACYSGMLITMIMSLKFDPVQAHNIARNAMFHYFEEHELILNILEDGKIKFGLDFNSADSVVYEMLKAIGDIKAGGNKQEAVNLRKKYVYTDNRKTLIEERTASFPLGRGLFFPGFKKDGEEYLPEMIYADRFNLQKKFLSD